jgi:hypothetical protein
MHSKNNLDYTIHYNGDFSKVLYVSHKATEEDNTKEIPPAVIGLLYSAIAEDILGCINDNISDKIWEQSKIGVRCEPYYQQDKEKENGKI